VGCSRGRTAGVLRVKSRCGSLRDKAQHSVRESIGFVKSRASPWGDPWGTDGGHTGTQCSGALLRSEA